MPNPLALLTKPTKVKIESYKNPDFTGFAGELELQVNPESFSRTHSIRNKNAKKSATLDSKKYAGGIQGTPKETKEYETTDAESISLDFIFDGTGIIPGKMADLLTGGPSVTERIEEFKDLTYTYQGNIHSPYYLKLKWGEAFSEDGKPFRCQLSSLTINYLLFKRNGSPLRAKLTAVFTEYKTYKEARLEANLGSPDMTHIVTVQMGDTLPMMCYNIYGDTSYYLEVARINGLQNIFSIKPGSQLVFPPLEK
jgi:hypothetical protein